MAYTKIKVNQLPDTTSFRTNTLLKDCHSVSRLNIVTNSEHHCMKRITHICCIWGFDSIDVACQNSNQKIFTTKHTKWRTQSWNNIKGTNWTSAFVQYVSGPWQKWHHSHTHTVSLMPVCTLLFVKSSQKQYTQNQKATHKNYTSI